MREEGYPRSSKQIKVKLRDLKAKYRKAKQNNNRSGSARASCPFFEELDAVLWTRPSTNPTFLLETTNQGSAAAGGTRNAAAGGTGNAAAGGTGNAAAGGIRNVAAGGTGNAAAGGTGNAAAGGTGNAAAGGTGNAAAGGTGNEAAGGTGNAAAGANLASKRKQKGVGFRKAEKSKKTGLQTTMSTIQDEQRKKLWKENSERDEAYGIISVSKLRT
ncbi:ZSCAN29 [Branchiostoma lanceolatum]|uniref:ZSCAN29 protein n=1 Tax=Branchiostoma lanceolatum TaxID=7740 RepID=A0A8J9VFB7_BRALA|nr:ZSCAN29 [Branchiostoma lanceolatum]